MSSPRARFSPRTGTASWHCTSSTSPRMSSVNALLRGRVEASASTVATVLEALAEICPAITPTTEDLGAALELAAEHNLTLYDAAYAAVAQRRNAHLATFDSKLLTSGLGRKPNELLAEFADRGETR